MGLCIPDNYLKIFDAETKKRASGKKPLAPFYQVQQLQLLLNTLFLLQILGRICAVCRNKCCIHSCIIGVETEKYASNKRRQVWRGRAITSLARPCLYDKNTLFLFQSPCEYRLANTCTEFVYK